MKRPELILLFINLIFIQTYGYPQDDKDSLKAVTEVVKEENIMETNDSILDTTTNKSESTNSPTIIEELSESKSEEVTSDRETVILDSLSAFADSTSTETFSVKEKRSGLLKNRNVPYVVASIPIIWLAYKYFSKEESTIERVGTPPEWPN